MTENRLNRIVDQLADLSDEEMEVLTTAISDKRKERKNEKIEKAIKDFENAFYTLTELGVNISYNDIEGEDWTLVFEDLHFDNT